MTVEPWFRYGTCFLRGHGDKSLEASEEERAARLKARARWPGAVEDDGEGLLFGKVLRSDCVGLES
jgi:hypothetical protein